MKPRVTVQVLCCEVDAILTVLLNDEATMDLLFSLLQQVSSRYCMQH